MRTKGQVEEAIEGVDYHDYAIYRPGLLLNRDNDARIGEKIFGALPFIPKIESTVVGRVMLEHAVR